MIKSKNGTEVGAQILIHKGKKFDDTKSLSDYELKEGDTLILMVKKVNFHRNLWGFLNSRPDLLSLYLEVANF
jgi:hypothetical protein